MWNVHTVPDLIAFNHLIQSNDFIVFENATSTKMYRLDLNIYVYFNLYLTMLTEWA